MIFIQPEWMEAVLEKVGQPFILHESNSVQVLQLMRCLTGGSSPLEKETQLIHTLSSLINYSDKVPVAIDSPAYEGRSLRHIKDYLDHHYRENITLDTLSEISGLSKYYLIRLFKEKYHVPPHTYQILLRINFAKREIRKSRSFAEVAQEAGFYDQSHFIKVFKHYVGTTPEIYSKSDRPQQEQFFTSAIHSYNLSYSHIDNM